LSSVRKAAPTSEALAEGVLAGNRRALARAITLIESARADHRREAEALLTRLLPATGRSIRLGISGAPGVGKSTFIESFGRHVIEQGHRIAVLAVDPSSRVSGGSILGDKTRMTELARDERAFIRPSPAGSSLGGVARRTREALLACEAAGFDVVVIETVGVGQSETAVADMVDMFVLLLMPGGGDELQGIKRGIVELADLLLINKADGELAAVAGRTAAEYRHALRLLRPASAAWTPPVLTCSGLTGDGVPAVWEAVERYRSALSATGEIARRRAAQARAWLWTELSESLLATLKAHPGVAERLPVLEEEVAAGRITPSAAAETLLQVYLGRG
jgi:LAO/AO transport system kinase